MCITKFEFGGVFNLLVSAAFQLATHFCLGSVGVVVLAGSFFLSGAQENSVNESAVAPKNVLNKFFIVILLLIFISNNYRFISQRLHAQLSYVYLL